MARIEFKEDLADQVETQKKTFAKHVKDGPASVLTNFLKENGIDPTADLKAGQDALALQNDYDTVKQESDKQLKIRDSLLGINWDYLTGGVQSVKKFYDKNFKKLGDWSIITGAKGKIIYPDEVVKRVALMKAFFTHHQGLKAGTSPLDPYLKQNNIDVAKVLTDCDAILAADDAHDTALASSKKILAQRDIIWKKPFANLKKIGQYLIILDINNPFLAGDWGFFVTTSPLPPKTSKKNVPKGGSTYRSNIKIGGDFTNKGTTDLNLFKGKDTTGTPILVKSGETIPIPKNFSSITVQNTSKTEEGEFEVVVIR